MTIKELTYHKLSFAKLLLAIIIFYISFFSPIEIEAQCKMEGLQGNDDSFRMIDHIDYLFEHPNISLYHIGENSQKRKINEYSYTKNWHLSSTDLLIAQLYMNNLDSFVDNDFATSGIYAPEFALKFKKKESYLLFVFSPANLEVKIYDESGFIKSSNFRFDNLLQTLINRKWTTK